MPRHRLCSALPWQATLAATRGMVVQDQILVYPNATHAQLVATVKAIQRRHRPDAILW
jgi:hypothetical protein